MRVADPVHGCAGWSYAHMRSDFSDITARGFDIAQEQIQRARLATRDLSSLPGVNLTFDVADLADRLPEADASVDLTLCLYSALSHLPVARLPDISKEIVRVTSGYFITTVRPVGSTPTAFVNSIEKVRRLKQNHVRDRCEIDLSDGRHIAFSFHQFTAAELLDYFAGGFDIEDLRGLDLFHSRFMPDPRWNPMGRPGDSQLADELARLENAYATSSEFIDRAAHLLLVARSRRSRCACCACHCAGLTCSQPIGDRTHDAARVVRSRAIASGRPRTFMILPVAS